MSPVTPLEYAAWRRSRLGALTEMLEVGAVLRAAGDVSGRDVLDIGSGDGLYSVALTQRGAKVSGLDRSVSALQAARVRATAGGVRLALAAGDATALPFAGSTFDLVTAVTVLCFVPAPGEAVQEVARVLRPSGRLVLGELGRWSVWAAWRRVRGWLGDRTWARASFWTPGDLRQLALDAGLVPVRVGASVFHPPMGTIAAALAPLDPLVGRVTTFGAAFVLLGAQKPGRRAGP